MFDVNTAVGEWPFQRHGVNTIPELRLRLKQAGVSGALVSHLGCVLAEDPLPYNSDLFADLGRSRKLLPVPVVNPRLPGWEKDLAGLYGRRRRPIAIKVLPAYHNYTLRSPRFNELVAYCVAHAVPILLQLRLDDERTRYFGLKVRVVKPSHVVDLADRWPAARVILLNAYLPEVREIAASTRNTWFDTSFAEWFYTSRLIREAVPPGRILFGSHTPLLETRAAAMKIFDGPITAGLAQRIGHENATKLFDLP